MRQRIIVITTLAVLLPATAAFAQDFSGATNDQHIAFDPAVDVLNFDDPAITAGAVQVTQSGADLGFTHDGKTVWLDGVAIGELSVNPGGNIQFANGSLLMTGDGTTDVAADAYGRKYTLQATTVGQQVWGLGGADVVRTGSGPDRLVGNVALDPLNHVSRVGAAGAPTATHRPTVSADGRFVAFEGGWTAFGSTNNSATDVLVKDMETGTVANEHENSGGVNGGSGSAEPAISADGSTLAFLSASSLVPGPSSSALYDIYVSDTGGNGIARASTGTGGLLAADGRSLNPELSADGRFVVFESSTSNWAAGGSTATMDIFSKDLDTGILTRISNSTGGGDGNGDSTNARISADGRFVVFQSAASNLTAGDGNGRIDVFVWDRNNPGSLLNVTESTNATADSVLPDVASGDDGDGVVVFETARSLVAADTNNAIDVYAVDLTTSAVSLVSAKANGTGVSLSSGEATISGDGRFVAFTSYSDLLVPGDANGTRDILVKDRQTGAIVLVSRAADGTAGNQVSSRAEISLGGDWVVFESGAGNLAATDANGGSPDVFRATNPLVRDALFGGPGDDTYDLARPDTVTEAANAGTDAIRSPNSLTLPANVENLTLTGSANSNGTGNPLNNVVVGNAGNNRIDGAAGRDTASYATATAPVAVSVAIAGAQVTGAGSDTLISIADLVGSPLADTLTGDAGPNRLDGAVGDDLLRGGVGDDTYVTDAAGDLIDSETATGGTDTVRSSVSWTLQPTLENLSLTGTVAFRGWGNSAANTIIGNSAANDLDGASGNDTVNGGGGADAVLGGAGNDQLTGGGGPDAFVLSSTLGRDLVRDFARGVDEVRVRMPFIGVGDSDLQVEGAVTRSAPGGFSRDAELVVFTRDTASLTTAQAAGAIGRATSSFPAGARRLFVVDTGARSGVYLFVSSAANATVSAAELTLLTSLEGAPRTTPADYAFIS